MATTPNQIQQVRELIKSGKRSQALTQLARLIERDHNNAELWWLLANATDDIHQARRALEEVLSLEPANDRARKMLDRLETRQLLKQMGVAKPVESRRSPWVVPMVLVFVAASTLFVAAAIILTRQPEEEVAVVPTVILLPTETATDLPTDIPLPTQTPEVIVPESTAELDQASLDTADVAVDPTFVNTDEVVAQDPFAPTSDTEGIATPLPEDPSTDMTTAAGNPDGSNPLSFSPTLPINPTIELTVPPTVDPALALPESTQDPLPLDNNTVTDPNALVDPNTQLDPFGQPVQPTTDPALTGTVTDNTTTTRATLPEQEAIDRGQVLDGVIRRDLIQPYGVHSWTFSGYRGEGVTLELINITGKGNPSLELRSEAGEVVASDIDTVNTSNTDSLIEIELPNDGVYTVIVRMAAVDEQLYSLKLTRQ